MYVCACVVYVCQRLSEHYPMEAVLFNLGLSYKKLYGPFEPLCCAWLDFLMIFALSILQIIEVWTNFFANFMWTKDPISDQLLLLVTSAVTGENPAFWTTKLFPI